MNVLHGTGQPRLRYYGSSIHSNTVLSAGSNYVILDGAVNLDALDSGDTHGLLKRAAVTSSTWGLITGWEEPANRLGIEAWSDGPPSASDVISIEDVIITLPFCEELIEEWQPDVSETRLANGTVHAIERGFWYRAILNYSGYATKTMLEELQLLMKVYDIQPVWWFYPRRDAFDVHYEVWLDPEEVIRLRQIKDKSAHDLFTLTLKGRERVEWIPTSEDYAGS